MNLLKPVDQKFKISSPFGGIREIFAQGKKTYRKHYGDDYAVPIGTPVFAATDGKIIPTKEDPNGYGRWILEEVIFESVPYYLFYAHLSEIKVKSGQKVKRGDVIGLSGNSGRSTGPHLHFQVCKGNFTPSMYEQTAINPDVFMSSDLA